MTRVQTGDLLCSRASNNILSLLQSVTLETPITHVGLAVKSGDKVYFFESGAPRGTQLRDLDDYMRNGADYLWWRPLTLDNKREKIMASIEAHAKLPYCWIFLKHLPSEILGIENSNSFKAASGKNCGGLVASVYTKCGYFNKISREWFPKHFLTDDTLPWSSNSVRLLPPVNVTWN